MGLSLQDLSVMDPYALSRMADCVEPDNGTSAGASFLTSVRDAMVEAIESGQFTPEGDDNGDRDTVHEFADAAPDTYTHTRWLEFVDLAAYSEECETGEWPESLTDAAGTALYQIAERLCYAMLSEWREWLTEQADDDDEQVRPGEDDDTGGMPASFGSAPAQV